MQLEQKVVEVEQFYSTKDGAAQTNTSKSNSGGKKIAISQPNISKCNSFGKEKAKGKHVSSPELMRQFATIIRQASKKKKLLLFLSVMIQFSDNDDNSEAGSLITLFNALEIYSVYSVFAAFEPLFLLPPLR